MSLLANENVSRKRFMDEYDEELGGEPVLDVITEALEDTEDALDDATEDIETYPVDCILDVDPGDYTGWDVELLPQFRNLAMRTTYEFVTLLGDVISMVAFSYGDDLIMSGKYLGFAGNVICEDLYDCVTEFFGEDGICEDTIISTLKWATDLTIVDIKRLINQGPNIRPLATLCAMGFDGAVLRILGVTDRIARSYLAPWWHKELTGNRGRVADPIRPVRGTVGTLYPKSVIEAMRVAYGLPKEYQGWSFSRWDGHLSGYVKPGQLLIHEMSYRNRFLNVMITSEGFFFVPCHLFAVSQAHELKCDCGKVSVVYNETVTSCCGQPAHNIANCRPHLVMLKRKMTAMINNVSVDIMIIASASDVLLCYASSNNPEQEALRNANVYVSRFISINPSGLDQLVVLHSAHGEVELPGWHYDDRALIRTPFGVPGMCGSLITMSWHNGSFIVAMNTSMHNMVGRANHILFPKVLLDIIENGIMSDTGKIEPLQDWCEAAMQRRAAKRLKI